jgi:hypothetical protein
MATDNQSNKNPEISKMNLTKISSGIKAKNEENPNMKNEKEEFCDKTNNIAANQQVVG